MHRAEAKVAGVAAEARQAACTVACRAGWGKEGRRGRNVRRLFSRTARVLWAVAIVASKTAQTSIIGVTICWVALNTSWLW
jgi:hypothetical protein